MTASPTGASRQVTGASTTFRCRSAAGPDLDALNAMGLPALGDGDTGGLDDLLQIIEREVKPLVRDIVPVDADKEVLFGHSLGGMAVVHAAFVNPDAYDVFIASNPSIW
ncbi:alpha/beta hydrolase-fold protein [Sphingopyxis macrogoltabida]|nr:alpha/beta hydrolase-fold protein [Sphingopyxis macrogoltabida]